jgi:hypothetical protein
MLAVRVNSNYVRESVFKRPLRGRRYRGAFAFIFAETHDVYRKFFYSAKRGVCAAVVYDHNVFAEFQRAADNAADRSGVIVKRNYY